MPEPERKAGRPFRADGPTVNVSVPLTESELAELDRLRGEETRAAFLRRPVASPSDS